VIVAGTNGKGSTAAMLSSIFNASGYRAGLYTSPHLVDIRERWLIGGEMIAPEALDNATIALQRAAEQTDITPTYFEALTIIAFIAFRDLGVDIAVLEVGMGGRLDATNVVRPVASVITPVSFDHMEYLGHTLRKIAAEKAGVIHRGSIVLTSNRDPTVVGVLRRRAEKFGNDFHLVDDEGATASPLAGEFQRENTALAVEAARALKPRFAGISDESIARGIKATRWRGRLEHFRRRGKDIWVDGGHNAHAAMAIAPFIRDRVAPPRMLVFGIMSDKDVARVSEILFPLFDTVICTEPYPPRSMDAQTLADLARSRGLEAIVEIDPHAAVKRALASRHRSIVIAGSLYLAGAAIETLDAQGDSEGR
jgi:dihydrofolate synthase/folylpolyglutamate synthase